MRAISIVIYLNAFVLGGVIMGFEMLGSRYLNPYFGGSITTWAAIISVVLAALMIGYYAGGWMVDKNPSAGWLGIMLVAASAYMMIVPYAAPTVIPDIWEGLGDGMRGVLAASLFVLFIPVTILGTFLPYAIRLLISSVEKSGRLAGGLYSVSTFGSVFGTLGTTFVLIPQYGTSTITQLAALCVAACAASLIATHVLTRNSIR